MGRRTARPASSIPSAASERKHEAPDEATFNSMSARFSTAEIVQLLLVIGQYMMLARVMATSGLEVDAVLGADVLAGIQRQPTDGR